MQSNLGIVILAAGLGTRMKSDKAKVLHEICDQSMISYVVRAAVEVAGTNVVVVVGHQAARVQKEVRRVSDVHFALQDQQLGTGHAVLCALPHIPAQVQEVVILCGDVPLISATTIDRLVKDHSTNQRDVSLLAVDVDNPTGYGRVLFDPDGKLIGIVEEADADADQKRIERINSGIYVAKRSFLEAVLPKIRSDNAQQEIYLTDIISIGYGQNKNIGAVIGSDSHEILGVNSCDELQTAENLMKIRACEKS